MSIKKFNPGDMTDFTKPKTKPNKFPSKPENPASPIDKKLEQKEGPNDPNMQREKSPKTTLEERRKKREDELKKKQQLRELERKKRQLMRKAGLRVAAKFVAVEINREFLEKLRKKSPKTVDELMDQVGAKDFKELKKIMEDPQLWKEMQMIIEMNRPIPPDIEEREAAISPKLKALALLGFLWNTTHALPNKNITKDMIKKEVGTMLKGSPEWKKKMREERKKIDKGLEEKGIFKELKEKK